MSRDDVDVDIVDVRGPYLKVASTGRYRGATRSRDV